jgi:hypothetical protein
MYGISGGRAGSSKFSPRTYLEEDPDVALAYGQTN